MKVGVLSGSIEAGGAQRVCLKMVEALKEADHDVSLITLKKTDWPVVQKMFGAVTKPDHEIVLLKRDFPAFDAYKPLFAAIAAPAVKRRFDLELLINSQGDTLPVAADIIYVHFPTFSEFEIAGINLKYSRSLFWRAYIAPYKLVHGFFSNYLKSGIIVTNSIFSANAIRKHIGKEPVVIVPPVNTAQFSAVAKSQKRENLVVACGRYSPEKNYESILRIAQNLNYVKFKIVGSFSGEKSSRYYVKLCSMKSEGNLANVELLKNLPFDGLLELYGRAIIYVHAMKDEHFGIAIVEAMAAGLVPVVFRAGGPWEEILKKKQGYYGFSYRTIDEAEAAIATLIKNDGLRYEIVTRNKTYVTMFSDSVFKAMFLSLVNKIV